MILRDANNNVYHAHFRHEQVDERDANRRRWRRAGSGTTRWWMATECFLHAGECPNPNRQKGEPCAHTTGFRGVSHCSRLDNFNRRVGLKLSFERALLAMFPRSEASAFPMRAALWASFWTKVRPPRKSR